MLLRALHQGPGFAVPHEHSFATLSALYGAIGAEAAQDRHHLGAFGVRFVPRGQRARRWRLAREALLTTAAREVFASTMLATAGLG